MCDVLVDCGGGAGESDAPVPHKEVIEDTGKAEVDDGEGRGVPRPGEENTSPAPPREGGVFIDAEEAPEEINDALPTEGGTLLDSTLVLLVACRRLPSPLIVTESFVA